MPNSSYDFSEQYSRMGDDELLRLSADSESLLDEARLALNGELQRRAIDSVRLPIEPQQAEPARPSSRRTGSLRWKRLGVFIFAGVVSLLCILFAFGSKLNPAAEIALGKMSVYFVLGGWGFTEAISGRWLTVAKTWIIAAIICLVGLAWVAFATR